jgi:PAS domain S-box-containing protein
MTYEIFQSANDVILAIALSGKIKECNSCVEKIYGYQPEEMIGNDFSLLLPLEKQKEFEWVREKVLFGENTEAIETERMHKSGATLVMSVSYSPIKDEGGKIIGISSIERKASLFRTVASKAQALLETAPDAMVIVNSVGQIVLVNAQTEKLFGYKKEELLGKEVEILIPQRFLGKHEGHRKNFFSNPKARAMGVGLELFGKRKDNKEFPVEISLSPLSTESGTFVSAAIRDITERKDTEKAIGLLASIVESTDDAIISETLDGTITSWNKGAERIFGYTPYEAIGNNIQIIFPPELVWEEKELLERIKNGEHIEHYETVRLTKEGKKVDVSLTISALKNNTGNLIGASKISRDITKQKKAERKFRDLLESAPDAIIIVNEQGIIQLINAQTEKMFGYIRDEIIGKNIELLMPDRYDITHRMHRTTYFKSPKVRQMGEGLELFGKKKDGTEFPVEISLSPLETEEGLLVSAAIRDISEKKHMEIQVREANINLEKKVRLRTAELERKNKELEQFAYVASHDLQEPLRTTTSFVELFRKKYKGKIDERADKYLDFIVQATDRMKVLIKDLLDYSRIGRKTELQKVDCNIILSEVLADLNKAIKDVHAEIISDQLPVIKGYPTELKQLFQNLISNALKFRKIDVNPLINISAEKNNEHWTFSFKDNGIGIEERYYEKIFIIFQRLHTRNEFEGSGIGLSHCKKIVELHGGKIWVESRIGEGSTFYFTIPEN